MEQLEAIYEELPSIDGFIERKKTIPANSVNIYGPPLSGKTWIALDFLSRIPKSNYLYIDFDDLRIDLSSLQTSLKSFVKQNSIELIVADHLKEKFLFPKVPQLIIISQKPLGYENLPILKILPLDFEEYLAFQRNPRNLEHAFSSYLRTGSLPQMANIAENSITTKLHKALRTIFCTEYELVVFKHLSRFMGKQVSAHQLYTQIKKSHKISKDKLYKTIQELKDRGIIDWISKIDQPRAPKRLILFDFALPISLYFEKSLMGELYSLSASKMIQTHPHITFTDHFNLYDSKNRHAVLLSPFANAQTIASKISKFTAEIDRLNIDKITILTIANTFDFIFDRTPISAKPFYTWVIED